MQMIKILLMILVLAMGLSGESQCEKDIKKLFPLAENWTLFTTDFGNYFSTKITVKNSSSPLLINYQIIDSESKPIFIDTIRVPYTIKPESCFKKQIWINTIIFIAGMITGHLVF